MSERALRGTRLGATSYETDEGVLPAARQDTTYDCPEGHSFTMPFAEEADVPATWECRTCGQPALRRDGERPEAKPVKAARTHWDMLMERRTIPELEELLAERLDLLRANGGAPAATRKSA
jgi:hypothetical protein